MKSRDIARAVVYDFTNEGYRFLLLKAPKGGGYWQFPQGGVDPGESSEDAAYREAYEETGLEGKLQEGIEVKLEYKAHKTNKATGTQEPIEVRLTGHALRADSSLEVVLSEEDGHLDSGWFTHEETFERLTRYPQQREVFTEITEQLYSRK